MNSSPVTGRDGVTCEQCGVKPARMRFCSNVCKDRWHNLQPHRIERSKMYEQPKVTTARREFSDPLMQLLADKLADDIHYEDGKGGWGGY